MPSFNSLIGQAKGPAAVAVACGGGAAMGGFVSMLGWILDSPRLIDWRATASP